MKIYSIGKHGFKVSEKPLKPSRQGPKDPEATAESRQDRIHLSKEVRRLLALQKQASTREGAGVRAELVERLRREIEQGTYRPDSRKVAEKMIAEAALDASED